MHVEECIIYSIAFPSSLITLSYVIGKDSFTENIPTPVVKPDCGIDLQVENYRAVAEGLPGGATISELVTINSSQRTFTVNKSTNLALFKKIVVFQLLASSPGFSDFSTMISISYESNGPSIDS